MSVSLTQTVALPSIGSFPDRLKSQSVTSVTTRSASSSRTPRNGIDAPAVSNSVTETRIDPHKALQPARKKLSTLEAQRIMAVLSAAIRRAELATTLPRLAKIQQTSGELNIAFGSEISRLVESNGVVISSYHELCGIVPNEEVKSDRTKSAGSRRQSVREGSAVSRGGSASLSGSRPLTGSGIQRAASSKSRQSVLLDIEDEQREETPDSEQNRQLAMTMLSQQEAIAKNLALVENAMSELCRNVLRAFMQNPPAIDAALGGPAGQLRSQETDEMIRQLKELRDFLMSRLLTTPVEDVEKARYLRQVAEKEKFHAGVIAKLTAELQAAEEQRDTEVAKRNEVIRRLQTELHQIERNADDAVRRTRSEAERQEAADKKNSDGKMGKLQHDLGQIRAQYSSLLAQHRESEQALRKRKFQVETEVENWIQKYDSDMGERQDEYEQIDAVYTEEKRQLNELEERFRTLEVEYLRIMDERRAARETREAAERELQMCVRAALTIQAFWRSFKVRKAIKAKKKRGGGAGRAAAAGGGQKKGKK